MNTANRTLRIAPWVLIASTACASGPPRVEEQRLVALPREARQELIDEQRQVDVAQANLSAARTSVEHAKLFHGLVGHEVGAAEANREAAAEALELSRSSHDPQRIGEAEEQHALWTRRMDAARAKAQYAERLLELREAELEQREAGVVLAQIRHERAKFQKVEQRGLAEGLDGSDFEEALQEAAQEHDEKQAEANQLRDSVNTSQAAWQQALANYKAMDDRVENKMFRAPPEPKYLQQQAKQASPDIQTQP
jgi:hypothetical protein